MAGHRKRGECVMEAGTGGPDGDRVFVFVFGCVKARKRESGMENCPIAAGRRHLLGVFGVCLNG